MKPPHAYAISPKNVRTLFKMIGLILSRDWCIPTKNV